jgi:hypothetical protein
MGGRRVNINNKRIGKGREGRKGKDLPSSQPERFVQEEEPTHEHEEDHNAPYETNERIRPSLTLRFVRFVEYYTKTVINTAQVMEDYG